MRTVWVFGDQLTRRIGALAQASPDDTSVLIVESEALLGRGQHVQRLHLVVATMRRFAAEPDLPEVRRRADEVVDGLEAGTV